MVTGEALGGSGNRSRAVGTMIDVVEMSPENCANTAGISQLGPNGYQAITKRVPSLFKTTSTKFQGLNNTYRAESCATAPGNPCHVTVNVSDPGCE